MLQQSLKLQSDIGQFLTIFGSCPTKHQFVQIRIIEDTHGLKIKRNFYWNSCISYSLYVFRKILMVNACIRSVCKALSTVLKEDVKANMLCLRLIQITIGKEGALNL